MGVFQLRSHTLELGLGGNATLLRDCGAIAKLLSFVGEFRDPDDRFGCFRSVRNGTACGAALECPVKGRPHRGRSRPPGRGVHRGQAVRSRAAQRGGRRQTHENVAAPVPRPRRRQRMPRSDGSASMYVEPRSLSCGFEQARVVVDDEPALGGKTAPLRSVDRSGRGRSPRPGSIAWRYRSARTVSSGFLIPTTKRRAGSASRQRSASSSACGSVHDLTPPLRASAAAWRAAPAYGSSASRRSPLRDGGRCHEPPSDTRTRSLTSANAVGSTSNPPDCRIDATMDRPAPGMPVTHMVSDSGEIGTRFGERVYPRPHYSQGRRAFGTPFGRA